MLGRAQAKAGLRMRKQASGPSWFRAECLEIVLLFQIQKQF
jgi:hypothetical protein